MKRYVFWFMFWTVWASVTAAGLCVIAARPAYEMEYDAVHAPGHIDANVVGTVSITSEYQIVSLDVGDKVMDCGFISQTGYICNF